VEQHPLRPALICLLIGATVHGQEETFKSVMQDGIKLFQEEGYDQAITKFARARQLSPQDWRGHAWQAFTLVRQAGEEKRRARRNSLLDKAEALTGPLVKQAGLLFQDPLRHYILGIVESNRGNLETALNHFTYARRARRSLMERYAEIRLRDQTDRAYGDSAVRLAMSRIMGGQFEEAGKMLDHAAGILPEGDGGWFFLERARAVVDRARGRYEDALVHLEACMKLGGEKNEITGAIALVHLESGDLAAARAVLKGAPAEERHPEIVVARCRAEKMDALKNAEMRAAALAACRAGMKSLPARESYRLALDFSDLALAGDSADLAREAAGYLEGEIKIRPNWPPLYAALERLHGRLGDKEKAAEFGRLFALKKKEWAENPRLDMLGRPLPQ
jgi:tetratricopeptide (TPR) repeat protein